MKLIKVVANSLLLPFVIALILFVIVVATLGKRLNIDYKSVFEDEEFQYTD